MRTAALLALLALGACSSTGTSCLGLRPVYLSADTIAHLQDGEARDLLALDRQVVRLCGGGR